MRVREGDLYTSFYHISAVTKVHGPLQYLAVSYTKIEIGHWATVTLYPIDFIEPETKFQKGGELSRICTDAYSITLP